MAGSDARSRAVARLFGIDERTLHRHLAAQKTSFRDLVDEVRYDLAQQLLRNTVIPLDKIAEILDYSEVSACTRAFGRWSGISPGQWRKGQAGQTLQRSFG
ncbi:MAG: helix-turn-helix transcriptional regulator [Acetobacteraceae bacterium]|nr:helix-turn-helix transcriptional regulator [Acetobacteraceae bacterium]MBV8399047.1 helix-turn-helix transcriptional regulator [Acetobacteraceae bacterium]